MDTREKQVIEAIRLRDADQLEALLEQGVPANSEPRNFGPVHFAVIAQFPEGLAKLAKAGAALNARDDSGRSPLHYACMLGMDDVVTLLLNNGAEVNARDDAGQSALDWAVKLSHTSTQGLLRERGGASYAQGSWSSRSTDRDHGKDRQR